MSQSDSNTALVPVQSSALAIRGSASLAKRGLGELQLLESAEAWFEKAKKAKSEERFEESYQCLKRVVALNPLHARCARFGLAMQTSMATASGRDSRRGGGGELLRESRCIGGAWRLAQQIAYWLANSSSVVAR